MVIDLREIKNLKKKKKKKTKKKKQKSKEEWMCVGKWVWYLLLKAKHAMKVQ